MVGCGYTIAFQTGAPWSEDAEEKWPIQVYDESFWFFQWTFAATAATIDSGAIAERVNYLSYVVMSCLTTGMVYPVAVGWVWTSEGYLAALGFLDFAGGAVVHMLGACSALCCCLVVGPRIGRFPRLHSKLPVACKECMCALSRCRLLCNACRTEADH